MTCECTHAIYTHGIQNTDIDLPVPLLHTNQSFPAPTGLRGKAEIAFVDCCGNQELLTVNVCLSVEELSRCVKSQIYGSGVLGINKLYIISNLIIFHIRNS